MTVTWKDRRGSVIPTGVATLVLVGGVAAWLGAAQAGGFEGAITMEDNSDDDITIQRYSFKGEKLRVDDVSAEAEGGAVIFDGRTREGFAVDSDEQAYVPFTWMDRTPEELKQDAADSVVTRTGKRDKVAGRSCEIYLQRDKIDGSSSEYCIAKGLANSALPGVINSDAVPTSPFPIWLVDMAKEGAFPLRGIDRTKAGREVSRFEATKVESKRLDDRLFTPPPGFTPLKMDDIGRGRVTR